VRRNDVEERKNAGLQKKKLKIEKLKTKKEI